MEICAMIGGIVFAVTLLLSILWTVGSFFKNVGVSYFNPVDLVFSIAFPIFCFFLEQMIFKAAPHAWGTSFIFISLNAYWLFLQYVMLVGSVIIGKKYIYRVGHGFTVHRYTFDQVKKCSGNYSSEMLATKLSRKKVSAFEVTVRFADKTEGEFSTRNKDSKKAQYFLDTIREYTKKKAN